MPITKHPIYCAVQFADHKALIGAQRNLGSSRRIWTPTLALASFIYIDLMNRSDPVCIAVIGGTGIQPLSNFSQVASLNIDTIWGAPSSLIEILHHLSPTNGSPTPVAFLCRHGLHHEYAPHEVPSQANIVVLRSLGVRTIIAFSAVGSLQEEVKPRDFLAPDQIIDRTKGIRPFTFFEGGMVGHVGFADPFDEGRARVVRKCGHSLEGEGIRLHNTGTLVCKGVYSSIPNFEIH